MLPELEWKQRNAQREKTQGAWGSHRKLSIHVGYYEKEKEEPKGYLKDRHRETNRATEIPACHVNRFYFIL